MDVLQKLIQLIWSPSEKPYLQKSDLLDYHIPVQINTTVSSKDTRSQSDVASWEKQYWETE